MDRFARGNRPYIPFSQTPRSNAWKAALDLELFCRSRNLGVRGCSRRKACSTFVQAIRTGAPKCSCRKIAITLTIRGSECKRLFTATAARFNAAYGSYDSSMKMFASDV